MPSLKRTSWSPPHLVQVKAMHWMRGFTALILTTVPLTLTILPVHKHHVVWLAIKQTTTVCCSKLQVAQVIGASACRPNYTWLRCSAYQLSLT